MIYSWSASNETFLYHLGLIDCFQNYSLYKAFQKWFVTKIIQKENYSMMDPERYRTRFMDFIKEYVIIN